MRLSLHFLSSSFSVEPFTPVPARLMRTILSLPLYESVRNCGGMIDPIWAQSFFMRGGLS